MRTKIWHPKPNFNIKILQENTTNQQMILMPVGDVHAYSRGWPQEKFVNHLKWGMDRGATFLGMGEYLDFTSTSQREKLAGLRISCSEELDEMVMEKIMEFADLISFTKGNGNWVGLIEGDHYHEFQNRKTTAQVLCEYLGCDYLGDMAMIRIEMNVPGNKLAVCTVVAHHGVGSASTAGGHLNRVEKMAGWLAADIYLMGHSHSKANTAIDMLTFDGNVLYHRTKLIARTGGWFRGYDSGFPLSLDRPAYESQGSYVEKKAMMPTAIGGIAIDIGYDKVEGCDIYRPTIHCRS